jgi:hypothetical protein
MEQNRKDLGDIGRRRKQNMEVMPVILSCRRRKANLCSSWEGKKQQE